jgi:hypothetical protein
VADRFIGNRIINSLCPSTGPSVCLHGRGAERLTPTQASFCRPGALAPMPGTGRWSQSR